MPSPADAPFPFRKLITTWRSLDHQVIVVATERVEGAWCAYIGAVPGYSHLNEWALVRDNGSKLDERVARAIFDREDHLLSLPYTL